VQINNSLKRKLIIAGKLIVIFGAMMSFVLFRPGWNRLDYVFFAAIAFTISLIGVRIETYISEGVRHVSWRILSFLFILAIVEFVAAAPFWPSILMYIPIYGVFLSAIYASKQNAADRKRDDSISWDIGGDKRTADAYKRYYQAKFEQEQNEKRRREESRRQNDYHRRQSENSQREDYQQNEEKTPIFPTRNSVYFYDCMTQQEVKERYRDLVKKYHPDNPGGNVEIFRKVNEEYEKFEDIV